MNTHEHDSSRESCETSFSSLFRKSVFVTRHELSNVVLGHYHPDVVDWSYPTLGTHREASCYWRFRDVGIEVLNVGGWLTHGDAALDSD